MRGHKVQCLKIITQEISPKFSNFAKSHLGKGSTWQAQHMSMDNGYNITDFVNIAKSKCHINSQKITVNVEKGQTQLMLETSSG